MDVHVVTHKLRLDTILQSKINVPMVLCYSSHSDGLRDVPDFLQSQAARSGSLHDRLGACRLAVHAPLSVKMSCAGCGWAFEPSAQRPRTEWARESFRIDGPGIMSLEPQVAVKCRATVMCATPLNLCLADLSRTRRESFCCMQMQQGCKSIQLHRRSSD